MSFSAWIKSVFYGAPPKPVTVKRGVTRSAEKREAAQGQARADQADYEKRRAAKRTQLDRDNAKHKHDKS